MKLPTIDLFLIAPEIVITAFGLTVLLIEVFSPDRKREKNLGVYCLYGVVIAFFFVLSQMGVIRSGYAGMFISDGYAIFFKIIFLTIAFLTPSSPRSMRYTASAITSLGERRATRTCASCPSPWSHAAEMRTS